jgi:hypothetical protein
MTKQLTLIDTHPDWRLDDRTREVGFQGIAQARAALQAGRRNRGQGPPDVGRKPQPAVRKVRRPAAPRSRPRPRPAAAA